MSIGAIDRERIDWTRQPPARSGRIGVQIRVGVQIPVDMQSGEEPIAAVTRNISPDGAFVATRWPLRIGQKVALRLTIPGFSVPIVVKAEVRWVRALSAAEGALPAGAGVRFISPSIAASASIAALLQAHEMP
ncbi:MAG TPA: PilZ domain-containing protein [Polyangia bacterium]|nr:PilZ domain-containing protein [Polyangia bacterium]